MIKRLKLLSVYTSSLEARSLAQVYWGNHAISPALLKNRFYFTALPPPPQLSLSIKEQNAVVASFALEYLMESSMEQYSQSNLSIRQRLVDRAIFSQFVLDKLRKSEFNHRPFESLSQLGITKQSLDEVMAGFQLDKGMYYNPIVWNQQRITKSMPLIINTENQTKASSDGTILYKTVLNPFVHTGHIISLLYRGIPCIISGDKGIGKSFSYLLYDYLTSFIINCRIDEKERKGFDHQSFKNILRSHFYKTRKLIYITIKRPKQYGNYLHSLYLQSHGLAPLQTFAISKFEPEVQLQKVAKYAASISEQFYMHNNISTILLIDEANSYYDHARRANILQNNLQYLQQRKSSWENLSKISKLILALQGTFQNVYLNSSQQIQAWELTDWLKDKALYSFYTHGEKSQYNQAFKFKNVKDKNRGLQLYLTFWFQISLLLTQEHHTKQQLMRLRKYFLRTFDIDGKMAQQQLIHWVNQVTPLDIRQVCFNNVQKIKQIMKYSIADQQKRVKILLLDLKEEIGKSNVATLQNDFKHFLTHNISADEQPIRNQIIFLIRQQAIDALSKWKNNLPEPQSQNEPKSFLVNFNDLQNYKPQSMSKAKFNETLKQILTNFDLVEQKILDKTCQISFSPSQIIEATYFIYKRIILTSMKHDVFYMMLTNFKKQAKSDSTSTLLDNFGNVLFQRGFFMMKLRVYGYDTTKQEIEAQSQDKKQYFMVKEGHTFPAINTTSQSNLDETFLIGFDTARKNVGMSISFSGAPKQSKDNQGFDGAIFNKPNEDQMLVTTVEVTVSLIDTKLDKPLSPSKKTSRVRALAWLCPLVSHSNLTDQVKTKLKQEVAELCRIDEKQNSIKSVGVQIVSKFQLAKIMWSKYNRETSDNSFQALFKEKERNQSVFQNISSKLQHKIKELQFQSSKEFYQVLNEAVNLSFDSQFSYYQEKGYSLFFKHQFMSLYEIMRQYKGPENLHFHHIIAVPKFQLSKHLIPDEGHQQKVRFIYPEARWVQNGRKMKLSFGFSPLTFDHNTFVFNEGQDANSRDRLNMQKMALQQFLSTYNKMLDLAKK